MYRAFHERDLDRASRGCDVRRWEAVITSAIAAARRKPLAPDTLSERAAAIGLLIPVLLIGGLSALSSTNGSAAPITIGNIELLAGVGLELFLTVTVGVWLWRSGWRPHRSATLPFHHQDLARGLGLWVSAIFSVAVWAVLCRALLPDLLAISKETELLGAPSFWVSLSFSIYNAIFEELLWLGLGFAALRRFGTFPAAAISIGLRLLAHAYQGPLALVTVLPIGVLFTVYYVRTRRMWPIVVAHAFQDTLALTLLARAAGASS